VFVIVRGKRDHNVPVKNRLGRLAAQTHALGRQQKRKIQRRQDYSQGAGNPAVPDNRLVPGSIRFSQFQQKSNNRKQHTEEIHCGAKSTNSVPKKKSGIRSPRRVAGVSATTGPERVAVA
jgi:hypothetical protein